MGTLTVNAVVKRHDWVSGWGACSLFVAKVDVEFVAPGVGCAVVPHVVFPSVIRA